MRNQHRSAHRKAEIVVAQLGPCYTCLIIEVIVRIKDVVAEELVRSAMKRIRSRSRHHVQLTATIPAILGVVGSTQRDELRDRIHARIRKKRQIRSAVHVVRAVDHPIVGCRTIPVDRVRHLIRSIGRGRILRNRSLRHRRVPGERSAKIQLIACSTVRHTGLQSH